MAAWGVTGAGPLTTCGLRTATSPAWWISSDSDMRLGQRLLGGFLVSLPPLLGGVGRLGAAVGVTGEPRPFGSGTSFLAARSRKLRLRCGVPDAWAGTGIRESGAAALGDGLAAELCLALSGGFCESGPFCAEAYWAGLVGVIGALGASPAVIDGRRSRKRTCWGVLSACGVAPLTADFSRAALSAASTRARLSSLVMLSSVSSSL